MHDSAFNTSDSIQGSPDIGATITNVDPSYNYRAAVEVYGCGVSLNGLCRVWDRWRDHPGTLVILLHGAWMLAPNITTDAWKEIDFLRDMLEGE